MSKDRFSNSPRHIADGFVQAVVVSDQLPSTSQNIVLLGLALTEKAAAAEAKWIFKLAESDMSLRSCDHLSDTFYSMFSDSEIEKQLSMARQKASNIIQDRIGPLLENNFRCSLSKADGTFTLMFNETTTMQRKRQIDILFRFWCEGTHKLVVFGMATAADNVQKIIFVKRNVSFC